MKFAGNLAREVTPPFYSHRRPIVRHQMRMRSPQGMRALCGRLIGNASLQVESPPYRSLTRRGERGDAHQFFRTRLEAARGKTRVRVEPAERFVQRMRSGGGVHVVRSGRAADNAVRPVARKPRECARTSL